MKARLKRWLYIKPMRTAFAMVILAVLASAFSPVGPAYADQARLVVLDAGGPRHFLLDRRDDAVMWEELDSNDAVWDQEYRLGSLWKVFLFTYLSARDVVLAPYHCTGQAGGRYCSLMRGHGGVDLNAALMQSCELAFQEFKEAIQAGEWTDFWRKLLGAEAVPVWLANLDAFGARTEAPPETVLRLFAHIREQSSAWPALKAALALVPWEGTAKALRHQDPNGELVVKTFTMGKVSADPSRVGYASQGGAPSADLNPADNGDVDPSRDGGYEGGMAGWLDPDTLFWLWGEDKGARIAKAWFGEVRDKFTGDDPGAASADLPQVCTDFLSRYSITVVRATDSSPAKLGPLYGEYIASLKHGTTVRFSSRGNIILKKRGGRFALSGCFTLDDYIARVIQREGGTLPIEARKALAIVARTYLLHQAVKLDDGHLFLADSTRWQRVSIADPSNENRHIAAQTTSLVLNREVFFHETKTGEKTFSLSLSSRQAGQGLKYDEILAGAFPSLAIIPLWSLKKTSCDELTQASEWLRYNLNAWQKELIPLGADLMASTTVCRNSAHRAFYFDKRIYMAGFSDTEDQITLVHEWLHAAFAETPLGDDEGRIEGLAKRLVMGENDI